MVVVGAVVVVFWPWFVFLSITAWSQEISQLKIAVGTWWNPKTRGGRSTQWLGTQVCLEKTWNAMVGMQNADAGG